MPTFPHGYTNIFVPYMMDVRMECSVEAAPGPGARLWWEVLLVSLETPLLLDVNTSRRWRGIRSFHVGEMKAAWKTAKGSGMI